MFFEHSFASGSELNVLINLTLLKLSDNLVSYYYPHFTEKNTRLREIKVLLSHN